MYSSNGEQPKSFSSANKGSCNSTLLFVSVTIPAFRLSPVSMPVKRHNKGIQTRSRFTVLFSNRRARVFLKPQKDICSKVFTTATYYANSKAFNKRFMGCHVQKMIKICIRPMKNRTASRGMENPATFPLCYKSGCCLRAELLTGPLRAEQK